MTKKRMKNIRHILSSSLSCRIEENCSRINYIRRLVLKEWFLLTYLKIQLKLKFWK